MSIYVFLGPSLPLAEAKQLLDAEYLPPVSMGDVLRLMDKTPTAIAIIDGVFEQTPAVWHKEILFALSKGIRVFGASSMGALRAAELHPFGMEGVGHVFESFRDGILNDDDEVAVAHAPAGEGYRCLSDAMVNIREGLRQATLAGAITQATCERLLTDAKATFYPERSWGRLLGSAQRLLISEEQLASLRVFLSHGRPDLKRSDAVSLLRRLADLRGSRFERSTPGFAFEASWQWEQMVSRERHSVSHSSSEVVTDALRRHIRIRWHENRPIIDAALLSVLLEEHAAREPPDTSVSNGTVESSENSELALLSADERPAFERSELVRKVLLERLGRAVDQHLAVVLAQHGLLQKTLDEIRRKAAAVANLGKVALVPSDVDLTADELLRWFDETIGSSGAVREAFWQEAGFVSEEEFISELAAELLLARQGAPDASG